MKSLLFLSLILSFEAFGNEPKNFEFKLSETKDYNGNFQKTYKINCDKKVCQVVFEYLKPLNKVVDRKLIEKEILEIVELSSDLKLLAAEEQNSLRKVNFSSQGKERVYHVGGFLTSKMDLNKFQKLIEVIKSLKVKLNLERGIS